MSATDIHIYKNWAPSEKWVKEMELLFTGDDLMELSYPDFREVRTIFLDLSSKLDECIIERCPEERRRVFSNVLIDYMKKCKDFEVKCRCTLPQIKLPLDFGSWWTFEYNPDSTVERIGFVNIFYDECITIMESSEKYTLVKALFIKFATHYQRFLETDSTESAKIASETYYMYLQYYKMIPDEEVQRMLFDPVSGTVKSKPSSAIDYVVGRLFLLRWQRHQLKNKLEVERRLNILRNHHANFSKSIGVPSGIVKSRVRKLITHIYKLFDVSSSFIELALSIFSGNESKYNIQRASEYLSEYHHIYHTIYFWTGRNIFIVDETLVDTSTPEFEERLQISKSLGNIFRISVVSALDLFMVPWDLTGLLLSLNAKRDLVQSKCFVADMVSEAEKKKQKQERKRADKKRRMGRKARTPELNSMYKQRLVGVDGHDFAAIESSSAMSSFISVEIPTLGPNRFDPEAMLKKIEESKNREERNETCLNKDCRLMKNDISHCEETISVPDYWVSPRSVSNFPSRPFATYGSADSKENKKPESFDLTAYSWPLPSEKCMKQPECEKYTSPVLNESVYLEEEEWPHLSRKLCPTNEQDSEEDDCTETNTANSEDEICTEAYTGNCFDKIALDFNDYEPLLDHLPLEPWLLVPPPLEQLLDSEVPQEHDKIWFPTSSAENSFNVLFADSAKLQCF